MGPKGPNGKIVLIRFVHVHKKYKTRVGDRQRKSGYCGILAQKVYVRTRAILNLLLIKFYHVYDWVLTPYSLQSVQVYTILIIRYHYTIYDIIDWPVTGNSHNQDLEELAPQETRIVK